MKKIGFILISLLLLNGCATLSKTIPDGYKGPVAIIEDTGKKIDSGKADLFYLSHIDGKQIHNSRFATLDASYGQGNYLLTVYLQNTVPAEKHKFTIVGRTEYAMPIRALAGTVYEVKGDVEFSPVPDRRYVIKGNLSEQQSVVWIEDSSNGEVIEKIEVNGPSELGFFSK